jgi:hypothetical protein
MFISELNFYQHYTVGDAITVLGYFYLEEIMGELPLEFKGWITKETDDYIQLYVETIGKVCIGISELAGDLHQIGHVHLHCPTVTGPTLADILRKGFSNA